MRCRVRLLEVKLGLVHTFVHLSRLTSGVGIHLLVIQCENTIVLVLSLVLLMLHRLVAHIQPHHIHVLSGVTLH